MGRYSGKTCRLLTMFVLTFSFFLLEVIYGYISNSIALIADSFHMLSDVLALVIAFVCMKFSKKTSRSAKNTFGWVRAEVLGALVNTVFLIALSFSIILEAIQRFFDYEYINDPKNVLIVGVAGLVVNIIGLFLFHDHAGHGHSHGGGGGHGHSHRHDSQSGDDLSNNSSDDNNSYSSSDPDILKNKNTKKKPHNQQMNMRGVWLHVMGDAFGSVVVIVNAVVNWQVDVEFLKRYLDPILSLVISGIIIATSIPLLKESSLVLLQTVPSHINVVEIEKKLMSRFGNRVAAIHEFHVWRLSGNKIVATVHVVCRNPLDSYMKFAEKLKEFFHDEGIHSTTIQLELPEDSNHNIDQCSVKCPKGPNERGPCTTDVCCIVPSTPTIQVTAPTSKCMILNAEHPGLFPFQPSEFSCYGRNPSSEHTYI